MNASLALSSVWLVGLFVSWFVFYSRSGLSDIRQKQGINWREFLIPNLGYFVLMWVKVWFWLIVLVVWIGQGRPASPWLATTSLRGRETRKIVRRKSAIGELENIELTHEGT